MDTRSRKTVDRIIGLDGEGVGRDPHRYIYLAAADEEGEEWELASKERLSTIDCLDFILALPSRTLVVAFSFIYDLTKMFTDLPTKAIHLLFHEELRQRVIGDFVVYKPIIWNGYKLNYMNRRLTVGRVDSKRSTTVWDIFRFFQTSFVQSLQTWKVGAKEELDAIAAMKDNRATFDTIDREAIHGYCKKECYYLAKLARSLIDAHKDADLELKSYYGAGSTASVFLQRVGIKDKRGETPESMRVPVASAFFGGRFENSVVGGIAGPVYSYDISSAYPYQTFSLPCLLCGRWRLVKHPSRASLGRWPYYLVHWHSPLKGSYQHVWGPLPIRTRDGTIVFPLGGQGGWCWGEEFRAAQELNPSLQATEVWVYETDCAHVPFQDVPTYYRQRVALGKDSRGIVLKLGINSIYGKLAQSKGLNPPFQSWVWAGMITSNTRAQLLRMIINAADPADILMLATDGVYSRSKLKVEIPRNTGTYDVFNDKGENVPLGGWEEKILDEGVFCVRPGIYFPLNPTIEQIDKVRGRGLGRKSLYENWQSIVEAWNANKPSIEISGMTRFIGAKSGITQSLAGVTRRDCYGEWIEHKVKVSFAPQPKRQAINSDGTLQPWGYLGFDSVPYNPATLSNDALMLKLAELIAEEQPDGDFADVQ